MRQKIYHRYLISNLNWLQTTSHQKLSSYKIIKHNLSTKVPFFVRKGWCQDRFSERRIIRMVMEVCFQGRLEKSQIADGRRIVALLSIGVELGDRDGCQDADDRNDD